MGVLALRTRQLLHSDLHVNTTSPSTTPPLNLKADIAGGVSAAIIALPLALGFGVAAFAPLGREFAAAGALAGLIGAAFTGIFAAIFGGTPSQITGPTGPMTVVITATVAKLMTYDALDGSSDAAFVLTLTFATVMLGGVVQILLGVLRAGTAIKFIPYPVIAGFMNGIAVIIFIGQIEPVLGITDGRFWQHFKLVPEVFATAAITVAAIYASKRFLPKFPASLVGLLLGTAAYMLIAKLSNPELLRFENNPYIVGEIPSGIPMPKNIPAFASLFTQVDSGLLATIVPAAVVLGMLGAIDSLLTSLVADVATKTQHNSNRELIGQGIGNVVSSLFGGISGAGATVRTLVNVDAGGRGRVSGVTHGVLLLMILMFLGSFAGWIPMSVLGGILVVTSIGMVDTWSLALYRKRTARMDLVVVLVVTVVTVAVDLMVAVGIGFGVTMLLFLRQLSGISLVQNSFRCAIRRSKHVRGEQEEALLAQHGHGILAYELKGSLFFGSTSSFTGQVRSELATVRYLILDFKRIDTIDITGAECLKQICDAADEAGVTLLVSHINPSHRKEREALTTYLEELHVLQSIGANNLFDSLDLAVEAAEDRLLAGLGHDDEAVEAAGSVRHSGLFETLTDAQWQTIGPLLQRRAFDAGNTVFSRGDAGEYVAVIEHGRVSVWLEPIEDAVTRLATFGPGIHFGDQALLTGHVRSASVRADTDTVLKVLTTETFEDLMQTAPATGIALLRAMGVELSRRLRVTSEELTRADAN